MTHEKNDLEDRTDYESLASEAVTAMPTASMSDRVGYVMRKISGRANPAVVTAAIARAASMTNRLLRAAQALAPAMISSDVATKIGAFGVWWKLRREWTYTLDGTRIALFPTQDLANAYRYTYAFPEDTEVRPWICSETSSAGSEPALKVERKGDF